MPHQLTLKRETKNQYKLARKAGVPAANLKHTLGIARAESIAQIDSLNTFLMRKHPTTGAITSLIDYNLNPLLKEKERLLSPEGITGPLDKLELAKINIHIKGWEWLKAKWLPRKKNKKDFSYSAIMPHLKK
ncbi:MAG: hypothetical protein HYW05_02770 [Candidatus Diapherotrites archaeon]|nr:hypothetical protein [Candidatus Diapherotrites archaeon]